MWAPVFFYISKGLSSARGASARANNDEFQNPLSRAATEGTAMYLPERCTVRVYSIVASSVRGVSLGLKRCVCLSSSMAWVGGGSKLASSFIRWRGKSAHAPKIISPSSSFPVCLRLASLLIWWRKFPPLLLHRQTNVSNSPVHGVGLPSSLRTYIACIAGTVGDWERGGGKGGGGGGTVRQIRRCG